MKREQSKIVLFAIIAKNSSVTYATNRLKELDFNTTKERVAATWKAIHIRIFDEEVKKLQIEKE